MKIIAILTGLLVLVSMVVPACSRAGSPAVQGQEYRVDEGAYWNVTPEQVQQMLDNKDFVLVNVHVPYAGELPRTDLFIPYDTIESNQGRLPTDKGSRILVYCRSGYMSDIAARKLVKAGHTNVWNLQGGMAAWEKQGYKLLRKQA